MDKTAIGAIEELAILSAKANRITNADGEVAIFHDGKLISLEAFQEHRFRFRGQFATPYMSEFVNYVKTHGGEGFIDAKACKAKVFFNLGDLELPGHADWTATLELDPTAAFAALRAMDGTAYEQKAFVDLIEDWAPFLTARVAGSDGDFSISTAVQAFRNLTIKATSETTHTEKDMGRTRSALEDIEAKSQAGIPTHLVFRCEPYAGFEKRSFPLRVGILTGDKPRITTRIVAREQIVEDIANEFKRLLLDNVGDKAKLTIGSFTP